jgi:hypothetical protein
LAGSGTITGQVAILFGDLRQASMMTSARDITVSVATQRYLDSDQIGFKATERVDIMRTTSGTTPMPAQWSDWSLADLGDCTMQTKKITAEGARRIVYGLGQSNHCADCA